MRTIYTGGPGPEVLPALTIDDVVEDLKDAVVLAVAMGWDKVQLLVGRRALLEAGGSVRQALTGPEMAADELLMAFVDAAECGSLRMQTRLVETAMTEIPLRAAAAWLQWLVDRGPR